MVVLLTHEGHGKTCQENRPVDTTTLGRGKNMKRIILFVIVSLIMSGCAITPGTVTEPSVHLFLNGEELKVYTEHYLMTETDTNIPVEAFLSSIGATQINYPKVACDELLGVAFVTDRDSQLFMLEEDYAALVKRLQQEGKELSKYTTKGQSLLQSFDGVRAEYKDLERVLNECGIEITIDCNYQAKSIYVYCDQIRCQGDE